MDENIDVQTRPITYQVLQYELYAYYHVPGAAVVPPVPDTSTSYRYLVHV